MQYDTNNPLLRGIEIILRPELCMWCRSCEIACALSKSKSNKLFSAIQETPLPVKRIKVAKNTNDEMIYHLRCTQCKHAKCISVCKFDAIIRDPVTLTVIINADMCNACQLCVKACDKKVLEIVKVEDEKTIVRKCTYCAELETGPECVRACPTKALVVSLASNHLITQIEN